MLIRLTTSPIAATTSIGPLRISGRAPEALVSFVEDVAAHDLFFIKTCLARYHAKGPSPTPHLLVI